MVFIQESIIIFCSLHFQLLTYFLFYLFDNSFVTVNKDVKGILTRVPKQLTEKKREKEKELSQQISDLKKDI